MSRPGHKPRRVRELEAQLRNETNPQRRDQILAQLEHIAEEQAEHREQEGKPR